MCHVYAQTGDFIAIKNNICNKGAMHRTLQGESKKMSPLTKYDTIAPNLEINEIHFRDIDPDVHADSRYKNSIDRSRNV